MGLPRVSWGLLGRHQCIAVPDKVISKLYTTYVTSITPYDKWISWEMFFQTQSGVLQRGSKIRQG